VVLTVASTTDFEPTGDGSDPRWSLVDWTVMRRIAGTSPFGTLFKCLYSRTSIYFVFACADRQLTTTAMRDNDDVWLGDCVEIFLWPDTQKRIYFQYDLSPLGTELALLVPNDGQSHFGWTPWRYHGDRRVRASTAVFGGERAPMAMASKWMAEIRIPFALLTGVASVLPRSGSTWRANVYRVDHGPADVSRWAWCERTGADTHLCSEYGTLEFGAGLDPLEAVTTDATRGA
jgi:hypothetical protein